MGRGFLLLLFVVVALIWTTEKRAGACTLVLVSLRDIFFRRWVPLGRPWSWTFRRGFLGREGLGRGSGSRSGRYAWAGLDWGRVYSTLPEAGLCVYRVGLERRDGDDGQARGDVVSGSKC